MFALPIFSVSLVIYLCDDKKNGPKKVDFNDFYDSNANTETLKIDEYQLNTGKVEDRSSTRVCIV